MIYDRYKKDRNKKYLSGWKRFWNLFSSLSEKEKSVSIRTNAAIKRFEKKQRLFTAVEIETINRCNGNCSFCPVSRKNDIRPFMKMERDLYKKIIDELISLNYSGRLALFSNNEAFLDSRITEFARYARAGLPNAFIYLYTNATLLTVEKYSEIIDYLDEMIIDNYNNDLQLNSPVQAIQIFIRGNEALEAKTQIHLRKENEILTSRGGTAPNKQLHKPLPMSCILPYVQMVIRPSGEVSLCCNDAYGQITLGNVTQQTLENIWYGEDYKRIRAAIRKGRKKCLLCKSCDSLFYPEKYE